MATVHSGQCAHCGGRSDHQGYGALLVCNLLQSQDANIQTNASKNRVILGGSPSSGLLERRLEMMTQEVIPLIPGSSGLGWATREMGTAFTMGGASYLP